MNGMGAVNGYGLNAAQNRLEMLERQRGMVNYDYYGDYNMNDGRNMNNVPPQMGGMGNINNRNMGVVNQVQMQMYKGRPVANFYEANASLIDMDGSLHIFTDNANNRIYTKCINNDGLSEVKTYELVDNPIEELKQNQNQNNSNQVQQDSIGRNEFESYMKVISERFDSVVIQLNNLSNVIGGMVNAANREYVPTVQSNDATVPTVTEPSTNDTTNVGEQSVVSEGTANGKRKNGK